MKKLKYKLDLFEKKKAEMKGLGIVDVFKWKTNEIRLGKDEEKNRRFRKAVKDVIEQLKRENKIVYKTIKERLNPMQAFDARSCRKRSERLTSVNSIHDKLAELEQDEIVENHPAIGAPADVAIDSRVLGSFKAKKYSRKGCMLLLLQLAVLLVQTFYEVWLLPVNPIHLALRLSAAVLLCLSIYKYSEAFSSLPWRVILLLAQFFAILCVNSEMFYLAKPRFSSEMLMVSKLLLLSFASGLQLFNIKQLIILMLLGYALPLGFAVGFRPATIANHDLICFVFYCSLLLLRKHRIENLTREMYRSLARQDKQKTEQ